MMSIDEKGTPRNTVVSTGGSSVSPVIKYQRYACKCFIFCGNLSRRTLFRAKYKFSEESANPRSKLYAAMAIALSRLNCGTSDGRCCKRDSATLMLSSAMKGSSFILSTFGRSWSIWCGHELGGLYPSNNLITPRYSTASNPSVLLLDLLLLLLVMCGAGAGAGSSLDCLCCLMYLPISSRIKLLILFSKRQNEIKFRAYFTYH